MSSSGQSHSNPVAPHLQQQRPSSPSAATSSTAVPAAPSSCEPEQSQCNASVVAAAAAVSPCSEACEERHAELRDLLQQHFSVYLPEQLLDPNAASSKLGSGHFGTCWLQRIPLSPCPPSLAAAAQAAGQADFVTKGVPIVAKCMQRSSDNSLVECQREAAVYRAVSSSRYIPRLYCESHHAFGSCLVFEAVGSSPESLWDLVYACARATGDGSKHLPLQQVLDMVIHTSRGMRDLIEKGLCHGDVKPQNIIRGDKKQGGDKQRGDKWRFFVVDMGLTCREGTYLNAWLRGSPAFLDAEIVNAHYGNINIPMRACYDFFSLGMTLVFVLVRGDLEVLGRVRECTLLPWSRDREVGLRALLGPEISSMVGAYEQQLQQQGLLAPSKQLGMVRQLLLEVIVGLLQPADDNRWSMEMLDSKLAELKMSMEAPYLRQQQQQQWRERWQGQQQQQEEQPQQLARRGKVVNPKERRQRGLRWRLEQKQQ